MNFIFKALLFPFFAFTIFLLAIFFIAIVFNYESHSYQYIWAGGCLILITIIVGTYVDICIKKIVFNEFYIVKKNIFGERKIAYKNVKGYRIVVNGIYIESKILRERRIFINTRQGNFSKINYIIMAYFKPLNGKK